MHFDTRIPFASRLQCLACGSVWWSSAEAPKSCPKCRPVRTVDAFGNGSTTYPVSRVFEPEQSYEGVVKK
jgi:hypothetical protein